MSLPFGDSMDYNELDSFVKQVAQVEIVEGAKKPVETGHNDMHQDAKKTK